MFGVGGASIIGGTVALILGIKKSLQRKRERTKTGIRKPIAVVAVLGFITRWDADDAWTAKGIEESAEIRLSLERFCEENDEFPMSLSEIDSLHPKPTDYFNSQ